MTSLIARLTDRLLARFIPAQTAQAVKCECECSDKCWPCCNEMVDGVLTRVCRKELSCTP